MTRAIVEIMDDDGATYSVEEYVQLEAYANVKHELVDGHIRAMSGGTLEHARLAAEVIFALKSQLRGRPCVVHTSDARVRIAATGMITYPDVSVVCGASLRDERDPDAQINPIVLVEITSPSTAAYDRGKKFRNYQLLGSLQEYVVVAHHERRIEVFRRDLAAPAGGEAWPLASCGGSGQRVELASIGCVLVVDEIYDDPRTITS